jgi:hypothetical protein
MLVRVKVLRSFPIEISLSDEFRENNLNWPAELSHRSLLLSKKADEEFKWETSEYSGGAFK